MKAIVCTQYGEAEVLNLREVSRPVPRKNEVLIRIHATSVTVADVRLRGFDVPWPVWLPARLTLGLRKPRQPILGMEFAGEVVEVGAETREFKVGDRVFGSTLEKLGGANAEFICLEGAGPVVPMPKDWTMAEAAVLPIGARTALYFLKKGNLKGGKKALVYGASGSVGTYAVQLAKYFGAEVTAVSSSRNLDLLRALGADKVLDYEALGFPGQLEQYDLVFVAVNKLPFSLARSILNPKGTWVNVAAPVKTPSMLWMGWTSSKQVFVGSAPPVSKAEMEALRALAEGSHLRAVVDRTYGLADLAVAHRYVEEGRKKGNVVVLVDQSEVNVKSPL